MISINYLQKSCSNVGIPSSHLSPLHIASGLCFPFPPCCPPVTQGTSAKGLQARAELLMTGSRWRSPNQECRWL